MSLEELKRRFIRPSHECSDDFDYAKSLAGAKELPFYCMKCGAHLIVNNVCRGCGKDERLRYGDFEREMTLTEWEIARANLPDPTPIPRSTMAASEERRAYWRLKQKQSRQRKSGENRRLEEPMITNPTKAETDGFQCDKCGEYVDRPRTTTPETCTSCREELEKYYGSQLGAVEPPDDDSFKGIEVLFPYCGCGRLTDITGCPPCKQAPSRCTCEYIDDGEDAAELLPDASNASTQAESPQSVEPPERIWLSRHYPCLYRLDKSSTEDVEYRRVQPEQSGERSFQSRVQPWLLECFGEEIANDSVERNHRFLEESLELVQACGCTQDEAHQLVDYVFNRRAGEINQEAGGVMVTLAALCLAQRIDMHSAGEIELARILEPETIIKIRSKQAAKPRHSPLPESVAANVRAVGQDDAAKKE